MKTVIITGASRGLGRAAASKFISEGWQVIGTATKPQPEEDNMIWVVLDLTDPESITQAVQRFVELGPVDVFINNAGLWPEDEVREEVPINIVTLRKIVEVNLIGTIDLMEQSLHASVIKPSGHIILVGSMAGVITEVAGSMVPSYKISKVGLSMYTQTLAHRLKPEDITVSIIDPGWVQTDMGGPHAPRKPGEVAEEFFDLATRDVPTGKFWYKGKERSW